MRSLPQQTTPFDGPTRSSARLFLRNPEKDTGFPLPEERKNKPEKSSALPEKSSALPGKCFPRLIFSSALPIFSSALPEKTSPLQRGRKNCIS